MTITRFEINWTTKKLHITADAGNGHTIHAIKIDSCKTFNCASGASDKACTVYPGSEEDPVQAITDYEIDLTDIEYLGLGSDLNEELFFCFFYVDNAANLNTMRVFYNTENLAKSVFDVIKRNLLPCDKCDTSITASVADKVMLFFGFKQALELKEWKYACEFFTAIHKGGSVSTSNCGCSNGY